MGAKSKEDSWFVAITNTTLDDSAVSLLVRSETTENLGTTIASADALNFNSLHIFSEPF